MRATTLRGRLALVVLGATAVWLTVLAVAFNVALAARLRGQADELLRTRATAVAATVQAGADGRLTVREPADDAALDVGIWIYQGSAAIERPPASDGTRRAADRLAGHHGGYADTTGEHPARLYALPVSAGGRQVGTVVAFVALAPYAGTAHAALVGSVGLALFALTGAYLMTRAAVDRALRPVHRMSAQAARWSTDAAPRRFGTARRPAELTDLAGNLDQLLDALAAALRHEQRLTAELSHELRTPLARVIAETDWLTARPRTTTEQAAAHTAIGDSAAAMWRICDTLLTDARARTVRGRDRCDTAAVARELAAELRPAVPPTTVTGAANAGVPTELLRRILAPLLDNATRYARSRVTVACAYDSGRCTLTVTDDGPGIPGTVGAAVFEPGRRADPADGHPGAGLGLALARRLARAADGDLTLADPGGRNGSGATFVITLPAADG